MTTTICSLGDALQAIREVKRILLSSREIIIGMLDKDSPFGKLYEARKEDGKFFRDADFYSVNQVLEWLKKSGCGAIRILQTIFRGWEEITALKPGEEGYGAGSFVVISAQKKETILK